MKPTCPFKTAGFDHPDTCDENCAWLMQLNEEGDGKLCAVAVLAMGVTTWEWMPANYWNEVGE